MITSITKDAAYHGLVAAAIEQWETPWEIFLVLADWYEEQGDCLASECLRWLTRWQRRPFKGGEQKDDRFSWCGADNTAFTMSVLKMLVDFYSGSVLPDPFFVAVPTDGDIFPGPGYRPYQECLDWVLDRWERVAQHRPQDHARLLAEVP